MLEPVSQTRPDDVQKPKPAVFLDRDGTIIRDAGYLRRVEDMDIYPFAAEAIRLINQSGRLVVVVTNQSGVARALWTKKPSDHTHGPPKGVDRSGARIDRFYYCPHYPDALVPEYRQKCECRKRTPGWFSPRQET